MGSLQIPIGTYHRSESGKKGINSLKDILIDLLNASYTQQGFIV